MKQNKFFGPFHLNDFEKNGIFKKNATNSYKLKDEHGSDILIPNLNQPGIYIWGNLFNIDTNGNISSPTDCTSENFKFNAKKHQFIPYYVGKIEDNLQKRLNQHKKVTQGNAVGYIRFSIEYWKEFFKDSLFERDSKSLINLVRLKQNSVIYHNDKEVLKEIYPQITIVNIGKNHPITSQKLNGKPLTDTLDKVVNNLNNFWFCFCPIEDNNIKILRDLETQVYYSLKGKTTSKKNKCPKIVINNIKDLTNKSNIFKKINLENNSELIFQNEYFWGY